MTNIQYIKAQTQLPEKAIENTLSLLTKAVLSPSLHAIEKIALRI